MSRSRAMAPGCLLLPRTATTNHPQLRGEAGASAGLLRFNGALSNSIPRVPPRVCNLWPRCCRGLFSLAPRRFEASSGEPRRGRRSAWKYRRVEIVRDTERDKEDASRCGAGRQEGCCLAARGPSDQGTLRCCAGLLSYRPRGPTHEGPSAGWRCARTVSRHVWL